MNTTGRRNLLRGLAAVLTAVTLPLGTRASDTKTVPPGTPVTITVQPAASTAPPVSITLRKRHGHATPVLSGCVHTGGGTVDVQQPSPDTVIVTLTGVAVAYCGPHGALASMTFDVEQCFEVVFDNPKLKKAKMTLEARAIGVLRSHCKGGTAEFSNACATVTSGPNPVLSLCLEPHGVAGGDNLSVNDHDGPISSPVVAGNYNLCQKFTVTATAPKCLLPCKAPSVEFAPDPALNPLWISAREPFRGVQKKDFGFQIILKVAEDTDTPNGNGNGDKEKIEVKP